MCGLGRKCYHRGVRAFDVEQEMSCQVGHPMPENFDKFPISQNSLRRQFQVPYFTSNPLYKPRPFRVFSAAQLQHSCDQPPLGPKVKATYKGPST